MMSLEVIRAVNRDAAEQAARNDIRPIELFLYDWAGENPRPRIPYTGYLDPDPTDKRIIARYFVDISGWGQAGEQALTQSQFIQAARDLHKLADSYTVNGTLFWALVETGEFQGHFEVYAPAGRWFNAESVMPASGAWAGVDLSPLD